MAIQLDDGARTSTPVVKRTKIGEKFVGAIVRFEQRNVLKDGEPVLKPNGKPRQELVVHCITMPGTTATAGIGDNVGVPAPGDAVRLILRGKAFGDWIEAKGKLGALTVGDLVATVVDHAQAYNADGSPKGVPITDQAAADAIPRGTTVGFYGPLKLAKGIDATWIQAAERAYHAATAIVLEEAAASPADDDPFAGL